MEDIWQRFIGNLIGRFDGPMHLRLIVQPLMATILAIIGGIKDAKLGKPPFLWGVVSQPEHRKEFLRDAWKHAGRIFLLAIVLELIYQPYVLHTFYPGEAVIVAFVLAFVPYVIARGLVNRIARLFQKKTPEIRPASRGTWAH